MDAVSCSPTPLKHHSRPHFKSSIRLNTLSARLACNRAPDSSRKKFFSHDFVTPCRECGEIRPRQANVRGPFRKFTINLQGAHNPYTAESLSWPHGSLP